MTNVFIMYLYRFKLSLGNSYIDDILFKYIYIFIIC